MNIDKYKNMRFFDADAGGGEGGGDAGTGGPAASGGGAEMSRGAAAFEPMPKISTGDRLLPGEKPSGAGPRGAGTEGAPSGEGTPSATPPATFDPQKFAKEFGASFTEQLKPILQEKVEKKEMTPEEARKILKTWEPDDNWFKNFGNIETQADAVRAMRDGLIEQADTLAQIRLQQAIQDLESRFSPQLKMVEEMHNRAREDRFHGTYPQLKNPALKPLIDAVTNDMVQRGEKFTDETKMFEAVAKGVEAVIKVTNPEFTLTAGSSNGNGSQGEKQTQDRGGRSLPVTTPGGGGGTGRMDAGGKPPAKKGLAIFAK